MNWHPQLPTVQRLGSMNARSFTHTTTDFPDDVLLRHKGRLIYLHRVLNLFFGPLNWSSSGLTLPFALRVFAHVHEVPSVRKRYGCRLPWQGRASHQQRATSRNINAGARFHTSLIPLYQFFSHTKEQGSMSRSKRREIWAICPCPVTRLQDKNRCIKAVGKSVENVAEFKYLRMTVTNVHKTAFTKETGAD
jgi:hypothetical protein